MEVILTRDVKNVGLKGDVVRVRDGFGRNFLLPQRLAVPATRANREFVEEQRGRMAKRRERLRAEASARAEEMNALKVTIEAQAGEQDKLYGSVTAEDIAEAISARGFQVTRKQVHLKESIRSIGTFSVGVELYPQVKAAVSVEVVKKP